MKGNQAGDSATETFTVTSTTPAITLSPNSGPVGTLNVAVSGNGFALSDTTCTISGAPVSAPGACAIAGGVLTLFHFNVANVAPGAYTVTVKGNQAGDSGTAAFIVTAPSITLTPNTGPAGTTQL